VPPGDADQWLYGLAGLLFVSGLIWGWGLWHLWPEAPDGRLVLLVVVGTVSAFVSGYVAGRLVLVAAFLLGVVLAALAGVIGRGPSDPYILAMALVVPYVLVLALVASRFGTALAAADRLRLQLLAAKDAALDASRAKSEFIANMSHELRTPLNAIIGFSEIIKDQVLGPVGNAKYGDYATDIHRSGTHLLAIINDILDLARVESGKAAPNDDEVRLQAVITFIATLMQEGAERAGVTLDLRLPAELPLLRADERAVKQMLLNLISNAIKFTPIGGTVTVEVRRDVNGDVLLIVSDTGIGISAADLPRVMEPFGQVEGSLARRHQGTGLGLPLTRSMARQHGGELELTSTVGVGTRAVVRLPAERVMGTVPNTQAA
jgi:signal transduction histidine kinase